MQNISPWFYQLSVSEMGTGRYFPSVYGTNFPS